MEEVDAFLSAIRDTFLGIREPSLTPDEIRAKQFSTTRLRPGYDEEEVDAFLDKAESRLAAQVSARRGTPAAGPDPRAADPVAEAMIAARSARARPSASSAPSSSSSLNSPATSERVEERRQHTHRRRARAVTCGQH
jgi:DivIVA domain-containing protein